MLSCYRIANRVIYMYEKFCSILKNNNRNAIGFRKFSRNQFEFGWYLSPARIFFSSCRLPRKDDERDGIVFYKLSCVHRRARQTVQSKTKSIFNLVSDKNGKKRSVHHIYIFLIDFITFAWNYKKKKFKFKRSEGGVIEKRKRGWAN